MAIVSTQAAFTTAALALLLGALAGCDGDGSSASGGGGAGASGGAGGGGAGGAGSCDPPPAEVAAKQKVEVTLTNTAAEDRYLLLKCHDCDVLRVEKKADLDYVPLPLRLSAGDTCGCECPNPGEPYAEAVHRIAPGESFTATWDARTLTVCTATQDCGGSFTAEVKSGALAPVDPGEYMVFFGIIANLPVECSEDGATGDFTCGPPAQPGLDPGGGFYPVEIALPASGDVSAALDVP